MFEQILGNTIGGVAGEVIGGLLLIILLAWLKNNNILPWLPGLEAKPAPELEPMPRTEPQPAARPTARSEQQARNRARVKSFFMYAIFYGWTFYLLYFCISVPVIAKALLSKTPLYLDSAKYIGAVMPHTVISQQDKFHPVFFLWTLALYMPLLFLAKWLTRPVDWVIDFIHTTDAWQKRMVQALLFAFAALLVAGGMIFFYYDVPLERALGIPFLVVLVVLAAMLLGKK